MNTKTQSTFAVLAEVESLEAPLYQFGLTFSRLLDDIVVPYQIGESFFIDGVPVTPGKLKRIKLLQLTEGFQDARDTFEASLTRNGNPAVRKTYGEQYHVRLEHDLRTHSTDVTSQIIKAYNQAIKPSIKDYLPKRNELIPAALELFTQGVKALGA